MKKITYFFKNFEILNYVTLLLILFNIFSSMQAQVLIPFTGSNSIACGTNTGLCTHAGCGAAYSNSANGYTVINAAGSAVINISGSYSTESGYDYIRIYSGSGTGGALLQTYQGSGSINYTGSAGQTLTIGFTSDVSVTYTGLNSTVTFSGLCDSDHCFTCPTYDYGPFTPTATPATHSAGVTTNTGCRLYAFNVTSGVEYVFSTCSNGGTFTGDSRMILYNNSCTELVNVDDLCGVGPQITWTATYTGTVYLRLAHFGNNGIVSWTLAYWRAAFPGENCSNPQSLASLSSPYSSTTVGYADDISVCRTGYPDRIFSIDVPNGYIVDIWQSTNDYDSYHYMGYGGACPGSTTIYCIDDSDTQHNPWTNNTGSTQVIYFIIDGYNGSGTFTLEWTLTPGCTAPAAPASCSSSIGTPVNGIEHHTNLSCASVAGADGYDFDWSPDNSTWYNLADGASYNYDVNNGDSPNTPYYYRVRAYKCTPVQYSNWVNSSPFPIYTACDEPAAPTLSSPTVSTLSITLNNESPVANPSYTAYSIYCVTTGTYVTASGALGAEVYQTKSAWGTIMVNGLSCGTNYTFYAKAQNAQGDVRYNASNTGSGTTIVCPPSCATLVSPPNGGSGVLISGTLNWSSGGGSPTGYKLYFGTSPSPPYVGDLGGATSYDPFPDMNPLTTYYWQIVPYNAGGDASGCSVWSFTTGPTNDICANATSINEVSNLAFNTSSATASGVSLSCVYGTHIDLWYAYTATTTGTVIIDLCGSNFDTGLGVYSSCGGSELACNDDNGPACSGLQSSVSLPVTNGTTYYIQVTGYNGTTGNGDLSITIVYPGLWTGNISTDWGDPSNWDDYTIPSGSISVNIPSSPAGGRFPEINSWIGAVCNNLTINSGAHLFIPSNNTLTVNGTLTNNAGESGLRIESDASGTGSLISSTSGVDAKVERFLTKMKWHFIGMPVESGVAGVFHLSSGHSDIYLKTHIESTNTWGPFIVPVTTPLTPGRGYECWVGNSGFNQDETIVFPGKLGAGDYSTGSGSFYTLEYTTGHGLNLICNPYPSALLANTNTWTKNNIANKVWIWSPNYGNYVFWGSGDDYGTGNFGTMTGGIIPEMQAFFVEATGSNPSLTIPQSDRIHSSQDYYKDSEIPINTLRFDVVGNGYKDAIFINFNELSTVGYDTDYDIEKLFGLDEAPQLYCEIPGKQLSINALPALEENLIIAIGFECGVPSDFTITVSGTEGFSQNFELYLEDLKEGIIHNLTNNPDYSYVSEPLDESSRFLLHFGNPSTVGENATNAVKIYSDDNQIHILNPAQEILVIEVYDVVGRKVAMKRVNGETKTEIIVTSGTGYYLVKVQIDDQIVTQKVFIR